MPLHPHQNNNIPLRPIVLLDICSVSLIKGRNSNMAGKGKRAQELLAQLKKMAQCGLYRFSFLLPILEKCTDYTNVHNSDELVAIFKDDYAQIVNFVGSKNIVEPPQALEKMIVTLMDESTPKELRAELSIPASLALLNFFNQEMRVTSTPARNLRFKLAVRVADEGERLGLMKGYPTIAICIASIYGCEEARGILKIKKDINDFNPSNCLGDIMSFYRVANARFLLQSAYPGASVIFRTEDSDLESMHKWFYTRVTGVTDEGTIMKTTCDAPDKLLPMLYKNGECINHKELANVYALMDYVL